LYYGTALSSVIQAGQRARRSSPCDDLHDFKPVTRLELSASELRRSHGFPVVLDHDAAREQLLLDEKLLNGTRQLQRNRLPIGRDAEVTHG
jgi:hypothetical protein